MAFPKSFEEIRTFLNKPRPSLAGFSNAIKPKNTVARFINELPRAGASQVIQPIFRSGASIAQQAYRKPVFTPDESSSRLEKIIQQEVFGGTTKDFQGSGKETLQGFGANKLSENKFAAIGVGGLLSISDFTGAGKAKSVVSQVDTPVTKIIAALKQAKPLEKAQQALYSAERAKRVARVASIGKNVKGEGGFYAQLGSLKGELPKVQFESLRKVVDDAADPLITEARKYKSAEEFVNSFNLMKWGEVTGVGDLPISKLSKSQVNVLLKDGLPTGKGKLGMSANVTDASNKSLKVGDFQSGRKVVQPIEVSQRGNSYVIENGRHRLFQALTNGDETIPVVFKNGEGKGYVKTTKSQLTDIWKKAQTVADDSTKLGQADIDELFNMVEKANITPFEKISAKTGLANLLGKEGGRVPTKGEIALLSEVFPPEFTKTLLAKRSGWEKFKDASLETLNIPRSIMASTDLSAPLRQGILMVGKPKQFFPALKGMFKYAVSEKAYLNMVDDIKARPNYLLMRESKLGLTDSISPSLSAREEQFMSNFAEKIPGFGKIVKGSNRAYTGFLNKLRADVFDDLVKKSRALGIEQTPKLTRDIAKYVNTSTGRGELGALQKAAPLLNGLFFSPRLLASRLNVLNPMYYASLEPFARKEALKSLFTFTAIAGTTLGLAKLAGAEVGTEPTSSDFGKIKVGNTRYDIFGGFQQYIRLASQLIQGKVTSSTSGRTMTFGEGYKPLTKKDIILRFFESKESPVASFASSWLEGTNSMGEKFKFSNEVLNRLTPIIIQDMYDLYQEGGLEDLIKGLPTPFGVGTQTYGRTELIEGLNPLGEPTSQIRQVPDLTDAVVEKLFGKQPLGSSKSFDVEQYYDQLMKLPREEAAKVFDEINVANPDLAKQIQTVVSDRQKGITVEDKDLKAKGVASGDRALAIKKQLDKLKTPQEKAELWDEYTAKGIITKEVAAQLSKLMN